MRLLFVATKAPWPPVDGGRLLVARTLEALAARGCEIDLVAPFDGPDAAEARRALAPWCRAELIAARPRGVARAGLASLAGGAPWSIERHRLPAVRDAVARRLERGRPDAVHAEQLQALAQCAPAAARGVPLVLRCQNVESALLRERAALEPRLRPLLALEARRLAAFEGRAIARVARAIALTREDAAELAGLAGGRAALDVVAAPFPAELPRGAARLAGEPAVVALGGGAWHPNQDGVAWLVRAVWPRLREHLPGARLHLFAPGAAGGAGIVPHALLVDSADAFAEGSILAVPLRYASGVRMRILEAWARGIPVVATPEAARGLDARNGVELCIASDAIAFTDAIAALARRPELRAALVAAGRARLRAAHDPAAVAGQLEAIYRCAA